MTDNSLGRIGVVGRWKPMHYGGAILLETLCHYSDHVVIGIGSSNKHNLRNPFTAEESQDMIDSFLSPRHNNYSFIHVPDFAHLPQYADGQKWKQYMTENYGSLDHFVSGNDYVCNLLSDTYDIIHPAGLIHPDHRVKVKGTQVRVEMAKGTAWRLLVPDEVEQYLDNHNLIDRFRKEFGIQTLTSYANSVTCRHESADEEYKHTLEK